MKKIISLSLAILLLFSLALIVTSCTDHNMEVCYICDRELPKSEMDSGKLLDDIIYVCDDCLIPQQPQDSSGDDHGHDHSH